MYNDVVGPLGGDLDPTPSPAPLPSTPEAAAAEFVAAGRQMQQLAIDLCRVAVRVRDLYAALHPLFAAGNPAVPPVELVSTWAAKFIAAMGERLDAASAVFSAI